MFLKVIVENGKGLLLFGHAFKSGREWMGGDGGILVNIDLFAHLWATYIKLHYTYYIYLLKIFNSK
jgi:hypothetical protein